MSEERLALEDRVSAVMIELNSIGVALTTLDEEGSQGAKNLIGKAWSAAYDARLLLQRKPLW